MNKAAKTYMIQFGGAMVLYAIVLVLSITFLTAHPASSWRTLVALGPVIPAGLGLLAFVRFLGRMDELQRRIQFDAIAFAFGTTGMLTFAYGFLENAGFPRLSWVWVLPLMIGLWSIAGAVANRRYR